MRIVCPYVARVPIGRSHLNVGLCPETVAALTPWSAEFVGMTDQESYWCLLRDLWATQEATAIVEQDIAPTEAQLVSLAVCEAPWCAFPYQLHTGTQIALGCTRFSADLMRQIPDLPELVAAIADDGLPAKHWLRLDVRVDRVLRRAEIKPHVHQPNVRHLNPYHLRSYEAGFPRASPTVPER